MGEKDSPQKLIAKSMVNCLAFLGCCLLESAQGVWVLGSRGRGSWVSERGVGVTSVASYFGGGGGGLCVEGGPLQPSNSAHLAQQRMVVEWGALGWEIRERGGRG